MKTITIILTILLISIQTNAQDFWEEIQIPDTVEARGIFIASNGYIFLGDNDIYRSVDNGQTWELNSENGALEFAESNAGIIINSKLDITYDFGDNWESAANNLPWGSDVFFDSNDKIYCSAPASIPNKVQVFSKTDLYGDWDSLHVWDYNNYVNEFAQTSNGNLYTANYINMGGGGGVWLSLDQGETFEWKGLYNYYLNYIAVNSNDEIFTGSLYKSSDYGETWTMIANTFGVKDMVIDKNDVIYIGCSYSPWGGRGVHRSYDNGETWETINEGLAIEYVEKLALSPDGFLYCKCGDHICRSIEQVVSTNEIKKQDNQINIYPNPVANILNINIPNNNNINDIKIYNSFGQLIEKINIKNRILIQYNVKHLPAGIYFLKYNSDLLKFIKTNY